MRSCDSHNSQCIWGAGKASAVKFVAKEDAVIVGDKTGRVGKAFEAY
jgi:hypothetical protein